MTMLFTNESRIAAAFLCLLCGVVGYALGLSRRRRLSPAAGNKNPDPSPHIVYAIVTPLIDRRISELWTELGREPTRPEMQQVVLRVCAGAATEVKEWMWRLCDEKSAS